MCELLCCDGWKLQALQVNILSCHIIFRNVCAAKGKKISEQGELNKFDYCNPSPKMGHKLCEEHMKGTAPVPERLDTRLTRKMQHDLGLSFNLKSTKEGCRRKEDVT